jgi:hypothetical protein
MYRTKDLIHLTPEQRQIKKEFFDTFVEIFIARNALLEKYSFRVDSRLMYSLAKKASLLAIGEGSWEKTISSIVTSLEKSLTNHLLYLRDENERREYLQDAYTLILEVNKLKDERPSVLDNLPPPFRITLSKAQESEGSPS